ncbi:MAG: enoyl-CoA hydratase/isomerase family protein, partial [Actinobacteria bacterium]|nr:enoyl-CoA hydratase/isomerase family protein [Actinomycetota bacterium]
ACDQRILADDAKFAMKEIALGLVPDLTGTYSLMQLVGYSRALDICSTGRTVEAAEAVQMGMALKAVPGADLARTVDAYVESLIAMQEPALRAVKRLHNQVRTRDKQFVAERREQTALLRGMLGG